MFRSKRTVLYWSISHDNMRKFILHTVCTILLLSSGSLSLHGQEIRTNDKGEKIIVYPDGTWKYFNKKSKVDPFGSNVAANNVKANNPNSKEDHNAQYFAELNAEALVLKRSIDQQAEVERQKYNALRLKQQNYFEGLITLNQQELEVLNRQLYKADLTESLHLNRVQLADKLVMLTDSMQSVSLSERTVLYDSYLGVKETLRDLMEQGVSLVNEELVNVEPTNKSKETADFKGQTNCKFSFDGKDAITGKLRRTIEPDFLFGFTPENLSDYFKEDDMINCTGSITELGGGKVFLLLEIRIKSPNAKNAYGGIGRGSVLTLKTFEDEQIRLVCTLGDEGHYNDIKNVYTFRAQYPMSKGEMKVLKRAEVDQARIVWKTGYEDYEVLNVDFFINQFNCLK